MPDTGRLSINLTSTIGNIPIEDAIVRISYTGEPDSTIEELRTDSSGQTDAVDISTPPLEYSISPNVLFVTLPASNYAKILRIKRRYSLN